MAERIGDEDVFDMNDVLNVVAKGAQRNEAPPWVCPTTFSWSASSLWRVPATLCQVSITEMICVHIPVLGYRSGYAIKPFLWMIFMLSIVVGKLVLMFLEEL